MLLAVRMSSYDALGKFGEHIFFAKQELITRVRLRVQDFETGKNFSIRASDRSWKKKSNFAVFLGTNSRKYRPISREFRLSFRGKLHQKAIGKKRPIL